MASAKWKAKVNPEIRAFRIRKTNMEEDSLFAKGTSAKRRWNWSLSERPLRSGSPFSAYGSRMVSKIILYWERSIIVLYLPPYVLALHHYLRSIPRPWCFLHPTSLYHMWIVGSTVHPEGILFEFFNYPPVFQCRIFGNLDCPCSPWLFITSTVSNLKFSKCIFLHCSLKLYTVFYFIFLRIIIPPVWVYMVQGATALENFKNLRLIETFHLT